jgi:hypothetical protein
MDIFVAVQFGNHSRSGLLSAALSVTVLKVRIFFVI